MYDLLRLMVSKKGSDLFITAEFPPAFKIDGKVTPVSNQAMTAQHTSELARAIMNDKQAAEFERTKECNFAISPAGIVHDVKGVKMFEAPEEGKVSGVLFHAHVKALPQVAEPSAKD